MTPLPLILSEFPHAAVSCLETQQLVVKHLGFSRFVVSKLTLARRQSSHKIYRYRWSLYHKWCKDFGHSSSSSVLKLADFLLYLFECKVLSVSVIKEY